MCISLLGLAIFRGRKMAATRILRIAEVKGLVGLGKSTIYKWISQGQFPSPIQLGTYSVGWREVDIEAWIESRASARAVAEKDYE